MFSIQFIVYKSFFSFMHWICTYDFVHTNQWYSIFVSGDWLYKLLMHQARVFENQDQYKKSNKVLTHVIINAFWKGAISLAMKGAFKEFQVKQNNKQPYLAYWVRKKIPNFYDAMTISPCKSISSHIKHRTKVSTLNNDSLSLILITDGMYSFICMNCYFSVLM